MTWGISGGGWDIELYKGVGREKEAYEALTSCEFWPHERITIEHKQDRKCQQTGNLFIEYQQKGRDSGILTSEADYWALEFQPGRWLLIKRAELLEIVMHFAADPTRRKVGGDFDKYEGVLVPLEALFQHVARATP